MVKPHAIVVPFPAQGHVLPLMELSLCLANRGINITFINTEFNHKRVLDSLLNGTNGECPLRLISFPDGLESEDDRHDLRKLSLSIITVLDEMLRKVITELNESEGGDDAVTCVISDMGWALEVVSKMEYPIHRIAFSPASAALSALIYSIPKLIEDGIIDDDGAPTKHQKFQLSPTMPVMDNDELLWNHLGDATTNKFMFQGMLKSAELVRLSHRVICNSCYELEPGAFTLFPFLLPIGPLLASNRLGRSCGSFWPQDSTCLEWLDQQPALSVVYIAFGSSTILDQIQFEELALGLELSGQRFLWVIRPDSTNKCPEGFQSRVSPRGKTISWAPQQEVLNHPSVACFLSHCGWNSTMEGVSNGVPFLCWPYFADQFVDRDYICDVWQTGLKLKKEENGIISKEEISEKVTEVFENVGLRENALKIKEVVRKSLEDGGSSKNFDEFVEGIM